MSELLQYGLQPKSESKCVLATKEPPPLMYFAEGLDCLFAKINIVLNQQEGSLFYDRELGSNIPDYVFEDDTQSSIDAIKESITSSLTRSINNIQIDSIDVQRKSSINGVVYEVTIQIIYETETYGFTIEVSKSGITVVEG